jgi:uncharacterized membrane protein YphA (DoxX/SURF4 family)
MSGVARALPRIGLGLVLLVAGLLKGADPAEFVRQVGTYGILSGMAAAALAYFLIPAEVALGASLLAGFLTRWAAAAGASLMVVFMGVTAYGWSMGRTESCGCFGSLASRTPGEVLLEDTGFLVLGLLAFFLARREERVPGWKGMAVGTAALGAILLSTSAYSLPLDPLVTDLRVGRRVENLPLRESPVDLASGDHLVALLDLGSPDVGSVVKKLNGFSEAPGSPSVVAFYAGEVDEKTVFCFNYSPKFEVVPVLRSDLKRLYRKLPRFFRVQDGRVAGVWDGTPPDREELR